MPLTFQNARHGAPLCPGHVLCVKHVAGCSLNQHKVFQWVQNRRTVQKEGFLTLLAHWFTHGVFRPLKASQVTALSSSWFVPPELQFSFYPRLISLQRTWSQIWANAMWSPRVAHLLLMPPIPRSRINWATKGAIWPFSACTTPGQDLVPE